jgi:hypothetical protein
MGAAMAPIFNYGDIMLDELRILKLTTSEEIVGKIVEFSGLSLTIENPCVLAIGVNSQGKASLQMQPMLIFSEQKKVEINRGSIIYNVTVAPEIENKYNEIYGSGIVLPKKQGIIT